MAKTSRKHPVDMVADHLKTSAWTAVLESVAILIFGVLLMAWPGFTSRMVSIVIGVILIVAGIYQVVNYFRVNGQNDFFDNSLIFGAVSVILGVVAVCFVDETFNVFRIIVGAWLVFESLVRANMAIKLHAVQIPTWGWMLAVAVVMLVAGLFTLLNTTLVIQVVGGMMVLSGIVGIVGDAMFMGKVDDVVKKIKGNTRES